MQIEFNSLVEKFDTLALRLRIMLTACFVIVLFMIFDMFWFSSNSQTIKSTQLGIKNSQKQITDLLAIQNDYNQSVFDKRSDPRRAQLKSIDIQLDSIRQQLTEHTLNLVQPEDMAEVVKTILLSSKSLKLQKLTKLQAEELSKPTEVDGKKDTRIKLYRHSIQIALKGNYNATYRFLKKLEQMEKKVAFNDFEYNVDKHPNADVILTISTLSLQRGWIGG